MSAILKDTPLALRDFALSMLARTSPAASLTTTEELAAAFSGPVCAAVTPGMAAVILGTSNRDLLPEFIAACSSRQGRLIAVEPDRGALEACLPSGEAERDGLLSLCSDPGDLRVDPRAVDELVARAGVRSYRELCALRAEISARAARAPLLADESVDLVIIDMLLNRMSAAEAARVLGEAYRVLRRGGRLLVTALVADERAATVEIDFGAWRVTRAPLEVELLADLDACGFHGMTYRPVLPRPVYVLSGVELRAFVAEGYKGKKGICLDYGHAVMYRGPWREVLDDDGHRFVRGQRMAVCAKSYELLMRDPYKGQFVALPPYVDLPPPQKPPLFDCNTPALRDSRVTKGLISVFDAGRPKQGGSPTATSSPIAGCDPNSGCCE